MRSAGARFDEFAVSLVRLGADRSFSWQPIDVVRHLRLLTVDSVPSHHSSRCRPDASVVQPGVRLF